MCPICSHFRNLRRKFNTQITVLQQFISDAETEERETFETFVKLQHVLTPLRIVRETVSGPVRGTLYPRSTLFPVEILELIKEDLEYQLLDRDEEKYILNSLLRRRRGALQHLDRFIQHSQTEPEH